MWLGFPKPYNDTPTKKAEMEQSISAFLICVERDSNHPMQQSGGPLPIPGWTGIDTSCQISRNKCCENDIYVLNYNYRKNISNVIALILSIFIHHRANRR